MRILITGIAGFVGSYLADLLLTKKDVTLYGIDYPGADTGNIDHIKDKFKLYRECDIKIKRDVKDLLGRTRPDCIVHLAAQSSPLLSAQYPEDTVATNIIGQANIFEALSVLKLTPKIVIAGSSDEYGRVAKKDMPIKEGCKLNPRNLYALTKVTQELLGLKFYDKQGFNVIVTRPFHTIGPKRPERFVCSSLAKQIALIEKNKQEPVISVGNMDIMRDFTDVRDVVNAYWLLLKKGKPGENYNICSGKAYSIKNILEVLLSLSKVKVEVKAKTDRMRPNDVSMLVGNYSKLKRATGWQPKIPIERALKDLLNYWRERV
jgi:GDP-4-dehydro-6-deoxy-D-mannose reductase